MLSCISLWYNITVAHDSLVELGFGITLQVLKRQLVISWMNTHKNLSFLPIGHIFWPAVIITCEECKGKWKLPPLKWFKCFSLLHTKTTTTPTIPLPLPPPLSSPLSLSVCLCIVHLLIAANCSSCFSVLCRHSFEICWLRATNESFSTWLF